MADPTHAERGLRAARAAFAPSSAQRDSVRAKLAARVAGKAGSFDEPASAAPRAADRAATIRPALQGGRLLAIVKAGAWVGAGFMLGYWFADSDASPRSGGDSVIVAQAAAERVALDAKNHDAASVAQPDTESSSIPLGAPPPTGPQAQAGAVETGAVGSGRPGGAARAPTPPPRPRATRSTTSLEELALVQRAERAVRAGDGALARSVIQELTTRYPQTTWQEEREAVLVLAACTLDEPEAEQNARAFIRRRTNSVYLDRVTELCRLGESATRQKP